MKKILLVLMILIALPCKLLADCDNKEYQKYSNYTANITYDNDYSKSEKRFTITLYNVISDVYIEYNNKKYTSDSNDSVVIDNIKQGTNVLINVYSNGGCTKSLKTISVNEPYFNSFLGSSICEGYENKITYCTAQFTKAETTKELVEIAIKNYNHNIIQDKEKVVVEENDNLFEKVMDFLTNWGIKGLLLFLTCLLSINYYNNKYVKIKHGI